MIYSSVWEDSYYFQEVGKVNGIFKRVGRYNTIFTVVGRYLINLRGWEGTWYIQEGGKVHDIFTRVGRYLITLQGLEEGLNEKSADLSLNPP